MSFSYPLNVNGTVGSEQSNSVLANSYNSNYTLTKRQSETLNSMRQSPRNKVGNLPINITTAKTSPLRRSQTLQSSHNSDEGSDIGSRRDTMARRPSVLDGQKSPIRRMNSFDSDGSKQTTAVEDFLNSKQTESKRNNLLMASEERFFDQSLKQKAQMKDFQSSDVNNCLRTCIRILKVSSSVVYILIIPLMMPGQWCLDALKDERGNLPRDAGILLECGMVSDELGIPYSGIPMGEPGFIAIMDILCLLLFSCMKGF